MHDKIGAAALFRVRHLAGEAEKEVLLGHAGTGHDPAALKEGGSGDADGDGHVDLLAATAGDYTGGTYAGAAWLVSDECSFSTGAVYDLSGGRATY